MANRTQGPLLVIFAGLLWGTSGTISVGFPSEVSPLAIGAIRTAIGALTLLVLIGANHMLHRSRKQQACPPRRFPLRLVAIGSLGIATTQLLLFLSIRLSGVTIPTMIYIASPLVFSGVYETLTTGKQQGPWWIKAATACTLGCLCMAGSSPIDNSSASPGPTGMLLGSLTALGAGISWTVGGTCLKRLQQSISPLDAAFLILLGGATILVPLSLATDPSWIANEHLWGRSLVLGIVSAGLPYFLFSAGAGRIPAPHAFLYGLTEPLAATMLGLLVLKEHPGVLGFAGSALVIAGLVMFASQNRTPLLQQAPPIAPS